ncbi:phage tail tape measure C-terminal domain-containing protein [Paraburkholderia sp. DHOC27]|uniref:phage tail tape measure C-terminal domain-containing protein n=1 Tax=Paraburkholderia sp. DHOC27 TaxID=2303330 RepID=UPI000E3B8B2B|nr:phage tail tape measure C-terminal domain-containing protein [Paraburkholderia sp. DHOC27]RFU48025.1 hypothetical protein D0B32_10930 [Paraburkholderia sp. DHOC27]
MASNNEVNTKFTADSSGFTAAVDSASQRISAYAASTGRAKAVLDNFQEALEESGASTARQVAQIAKAVMQMDRMAATAGKTQAELAGLRAESLGISNSMKSYVKDIEDATKSTHSFSLANAGAQRELLVLGHELSQGNFKRFFGSLTVLANRSGAMGMLFNPLVLGIGAVAAVAGISVEAVHKAAVELENYAENVQQLSQRTGESTKEIQEWSYAAMSVGADSKEATQAIVALGEAQNKASEGNKSAINAFQALGISLQQVKSQSPHDMLLEVADAFQQSQDSAAKAAVAQELFGAAGEKLIPLLDKGRSGIFGYAEEANRLGGVLSDGTIKQLAALKDNTQAASARWDEMTMHAKAQLIPAIEAVTGAFSDNAAMGPIVDDFYAGVLGTFRVVATAASTVVVGIEQMATVIGTLGAEAKDFWDAKFGDMATDAKAGYDRLKAEGNGYVEFTKKLWSDLNSVPTPQIGPTGNKQIHYAKSEKAPKADESGLNSQIAELNTQIKSLDESRKETLDGLKSDLDKGLIDYKNYYVQSIAATEDYYNKEVAVQEKRLELAKQKKNLAAQQTAQQELDRLNSERLQAETKFSDDLGKEWQKRTEANREYLEQQTEATRQQMQSYRDQDLVSLMPHQQQSDYGERLKQYEAYLRQMDSLKKEFAGGKLDQDSYQERLQVLSQSYNQQEELLEQHLQREQELRNSYSAQVQLATNTISAQQKTGAQAVGEAFTSVYDTANSALARFVETGKFNFAQFTSSILMNLAQIAERMAMTQIFSALGTSLSGSLGGVGTGAMHFADGGHVMGAGSATSDSIPAMLSNGEFVVNAASTSKFRGLLESINTGQAAHFATGGYVGTADSSAGGSAGSGGDLHFHLDGSGRSGLNAQDAKELLPVFQALVDKRMDQKMRGQGGYAYQQRYGQI